MLRINRTFSSQAFIRNKELPICLNCLHFIKDTNNYPYDPIPTAGKCKKFGEINMITGEIEYDLAINSRLDYNKCGRFGNCFQKK